MQRGEQLDVVNGKQTTLNKHNGMASIQIATTSQHYSNNPHKNLQGKILKCNSNIYFHKQSVNGKL